jgi:hypothetical protein
MTLIWGIGRQEDELTGLGRHLRGPRNPRPQPPHRVLLPCFDGDSVESPDDRWMLTVWTARIDNESSQVAVMSAW